MGLGGQAQLRRRRRQANRHLIWPAPRQRGLSLSATPRLHATTLRGLSEGPGAWHRNIIGTHAQPYTLEKSSGMAWVYTFYWVRDPAQPYSAPAARLRDGRLLLYKIK